MIEDLSLHILDIAENAAAAGATRVRVTINENERRDALTIRVADNGRGMSAEEKARALDPFFTTGRKRTGLGLPLLAQTAGLCGGAVAIASAPGEGTRIVARFRLSHVDRPPLTKMAATMMTLFFGHPGIDFAYRHTRNGSRFSLRRRGRRDGSADPAEIAALGAALRTGLTRIGAS
ncbi:MAG TPA: ATP-binding protein [Candidatus Aminicenantes bacterium]|nr:ATP-binding protein [Candidatus Aminicenantes bacterium]HDT13742.1 ATP-binding protein [Candidatus Aminicenantes bacterium]